MALRKWPIIIFVGSIENRKKVHFGYGAIENGQNNFAAGLFFFFVKSSFPQLLARKVQIYFDMVSSLFKSKFFFLKKKLTCKTRQLKITA